MPIYCWKDKKTGTEIEILRPFDKYDEHPDREEAFALNDMEYERAEWVKLIKAWNTRRGDSWRGSKGNW